MPRPFVLAGRDATGLALGVAALLELGFFVLGFLFLGRADGVVRMDLRLALGFGLASAGATVPKASRPFRLTYSPFIPRP